MRNYYNVLIIFIFLFFLPSNVIFAQISFGGRPLIDRIALPTPPVINFTAPDLKQLQEEDIISAGKQHPYRVAVGIKADCDFIQSAQQTKVLNGSVWRLMLRSIGAKALSVTFGKFNIPELGQLFLYDINLKKKIGAFTSENNPADGVLALEILPGESIIMEYFQPSDVTTVPQLVINEISYVYRSPGFDPAPSAYKEFGRAGNCEVNVNCPEGQPFSNQKQGVVRILVVSGPNKFWCTGSVVNNTNRDFKPYILTAAHCWEGVSFSDFDRWIFYFNYESFGCSNPLTEPSSKTMSGASLISSVNGTTGNQSDFMLVQLRQSIPLDYNAWYFGWSREIISNAGAVGIHHPEGDIKKISSVLDAPVAVTEFGGVANPNGTYWQVNWRSTASGFGVTEGGSSGSPLINKDGRIIGTLTGGYTDCTNNGEKDYYGKVSAHWSNGANKSSQLGPWLDPQNTGISEFSGGYNNNNVIAQFSSDAVVVPPGSTVNFTDLSLGNPNQWTWTFVGGVPSTSSIESPKGIKYNKTGNYDVQLIAFNNFQRDTLLLKNYIQVKSQVYPNPTNGTAELFISKDILPQFDVRISNVQGMQVGKFTAKNTNKVTLDFSKQPMGIYFITVYSTGNTQTYKIVVAR